MRKIRECLYNMVGICSPAVACSRSWCQHRIFALYLVFQSLLIHLNSGKTFKKYFAMDFWSIMLSIVIGVFGIYYLFKNFNFFKRHGVIHIPSVPIFGNMTSLVFRQISFVDFTKKMYNFNPDAKYIGMYATTNPVFLLRDPELIRAVLIKNFEVFPNRHGFGDLKDPLFSNNLFSLQGETWRKVRNLLSPSFTSSKMKNMFKLMSECAVDFVKYMSVLESDSDIDTKDAFTKYTNDVIATCAFGIKIDSMKDPKNKFYVYGKDVSDFSGLRSVKFLFLRTFPKLGNLLQMSIISKDASDFFKESIQTTIATRDAEHITRPDMLQLMMDLKNKEGQRALNTEEMAGEAFIFFFAGFETTATTICFAAHLLATNPDVQFKLRQEIDKVLEESGGEVTYEAINHLEYLDAVINETLRMYCPVTIVERMCEADYELPPALPGEKPFVMKKGMVFWIPIFAIHYDEKYHDNPEEFRPERFLNKMYHNSLYYLPFGAGPRMCIANRFALLEIKVLLFHLLASCELKPCAKTTLPMRFSKKGVVVIAPENGFWLNIQRRRDLVS